MPSRLINPDLSLQPHQWFDLGVTGCQPAFITSVCYIKRVVSKQGNAHSQHSHTEYLEQPATTIHLNNNTSHLNPAGERKKSLVKLKRQKTIYSSIIVEFAPKVAEISLLAHSKKYSKPYSKYNNAAVGVRFHFFKVNCEQVR